MIPIITILGRKETIEKLKAPHVYTDVISINDSGLNPPKGIEVITHKLILTFDDTTTPEPGYILPEEEHINKIINFSKELHGLQVLLHCFKGNSRSTAAALILLTIHTQEPYIAALITRQVKPTAHPNKRMLELADNILNLKGKLIEVGVMIREQQIEYSKSDWFIPERK